MSKRRQTVDPDSGRLAGKVEAFTFEKLPKDIQGSLASFLPFRETQAPVSRSFRESVGGAATRDCARQTRQGRECLQRHSIISGRCLDYCLRPAACASWLGDLLATAASFASVRLHLANGEAIVVPITRPITVELWALDLHRPALRAERHATKEVWQVTSPSGELFALQGESLGLPPRQIVGVPQARDFYLASLPVGEKWMKVLVRSQEVERSVVDLAQGSLFVDSADAAHLFCQVIRASRRTSSTLQQLRGIVLVQPNTKQQLLERAEFLDRQGRVLVAQPLWKFEQHGSHAVSGFLGVII